MTEFAHTNIITDDWKKLAEFYVNVFGCTPLYPERNLSGNEINMATGIDNAHFTGIHLALPGYNDKAPTLEIFQYDNNELNLPAAANRKGFGHIAFRVDDVHAMLQNVLYHGGSQLGEIVNLEIKDAGRITFVYAKDVDGNIVELQHWHE